MSFEFDTSNFMRMVNGLSSLAPDKSWEEVLVDQVGKLLSICIRDTRAATAASIEKSVGFKNRYAGIRGEGQVTISKSGADTWYVAPNADHFYLLDGPQQFGFKGRKGNKDVAWSGKRKLPNSAWAHSVVLLQLLKQRQINVETAKKSRGLTKKSWLQIAESLGVSLDGVPSYVSTAATFKGQQAPQMGSAQKLLEAGAFYIEIVNLSKILVAGPNSKFKARRGPDGFQILQNAINKRARAFDIETQKGVFNDFSTRAKRYPGIFTN